MCVLTTLVSLRAKTITITFPLLGVENHLVLHEGTASMSDRAVKEHESVDRPSRCEEPSKVHRIEESGSSFL